jgi:hypothetical protein
MGRVQSLPFGFTISRLMQVMIAVPVAIVLFFAGRAILDQVKEIDDARHTRELTDLAIGARNLIAELQRERGLSAGIASSATRSGAATDALQAQRALVDEAKADFDALATLSGHGSDSELGRDLDNISRALENVARQRTRTDDRSATSEEIILSYTAGIAPLIQLLENAGSSSADSEVARLLVAYGYLLRKTELAGQERALLNAAFSRGSVTEAERLRVGALNYGQDLYEDLFTVRAGRDLARQYKTTVTGSAVENVQRIRAMVLGSGRDGRGNTIAASEWFEAATRHIDIHGPVADKVTDAILQATNERSRGAWWTLAMGAILSILGIGASLLVPYILSIRVNRTLSNMSAAALESARQIASAVNQVSSGANETASAVTQTTATVEEIRQTSAMSAQKAQAVADSTERVGSSMNEALDAVSRGVEAMHRIRAEVEGIAQSILSLSEKNIQIGEIIETVNGIAEQSNLLAVNASIEAAKAGEYGKGFSVVAGEVKALASQSQEATSQIRAILAEIQKASNSAVMVTEQGVKRVEEGGMLVDELGQTIRSLGEIIDQSRDASQQILLSSNQQAAGIEQATEAMRNIDLAMTDAVSAGTQLARAAEEVRSVSDLLQELIAGHGGAALRQAA